MYHPVSQKIRRLQHTFIWSFFPKMVPKTAYLNTDVQLENTLFIWQLITRKVYKIFLKSGKHIISQIY